MKKKTKIPVVYHDCNVVVSLVMTGRDIAMTKRMRVRDGRCGVELLKVVYVQAASMQGDGFSISQRNRYYLKIVPGSGIGNELIQQVDPELRVRAKAQIIFYVSY